MVITTFSPELLKRKLPELVLNNVYIGGGAIRDSLLGDKPADVDVFGRKEALEVFEKENFKDQQPYFSNGFVRNFELDGNKIQVCYRGLFKPEDFIKHVDFSICQFAFDGKLVYTTAEALISTYSKRLIVGTIHKEFAVDSLRRLQKYIRKGYSICDGGLKQIVEVIRGLSEEEVKNQFTFYEGGKVRANRFD